MYVGIAGGRKLVLKKVSLLLHVLGSYDFLGRFFLVDLKGALRSDHIVRLAFPLGVFLLGVFLLGVFLLGVFSHSDIDFVLEFAFFFFRVSLFDVCGWVGDKEFELL